MKITYAHLCDYALLSKEQKVSVMGIFNKLQPPQLPWTHPTMYLAFEIGLEPAEVGRPITIRIDVRDQDGETLLSLDGQALTKGKAKIGDQPASRQVIGLNGVTFKKAGPYEVNFWIQGKLEHTLRLDVVPQSSKGG